MFRLGAADVLAARRTVREFTAEPVDPAAVRRAIAAALTAPAPHHSQPWRFAVLESAQARTALLDDMLAAWAADLRGDGFTEEQIARRVRRGEPLRRAPLIIVPCLAAEAAHPYPDQRRTPPSGRCSWSRWAPPCRTCWSRWRWRGSGSCWVSSTLFCPQVAAAALGPAAGLGADGRRRRRPRRRAARPRPDRDPDRFMLTR